MLVLSRKIGEEIVIGTDVAIRVLAVRGNQVKQGIATPEDVAVRWRELCFEAPIEIEAEPNVCTNWRS